MTLWPNSLIKLQLPVLVGPLLAIPKVSHPLTLTSPGHLGYLRKRLGLLGENISLPPGYLCGYLLTFFDNTKWFLGARRLRTVACTYH